MKKIYLNIKSKLTNLINSNLNWFKLKKLEHTIKIPKEGVIIPNSVLEYFNISQKNSFVLGLNKALSIPTYPPKLYEFYYNPIMRVFRVIGGISIILVLTKQYSHLNDTLQNIILILATIHITIILIVIIIRLIYSIYTLIFKSKEFEVKKNF